MQAQPRSHVSLLSFTRVHLQKNGAPEQKAVLSRTELPGENLLLRAIAAQDLSQGETSSSCNVLMHTARANT